jgi:putative heme-binding domain-containing protein
MRLRLCGTRLTALFLAASLGLRAADPASPGQPDRTAVMIEALSRLGPEKVKASPQLKAALDKVLDATRGTAQYVELVKQFELKDQTPALLATAIQNSTNSAGVEAMRLVLESGDNELLKRALNDTNSPTVVKTIEVLGNTGERRVVALLEPFAGDTNRDLVARKQAVRSLAGIQEGAMLLLRLARVDKLPSDLKFVATVELNNVRWPNLQAEAAQTLPLPRGQDAQPLPPIAELVTMKGDPKRGAEIFRRDTVACIKCHQVNGEGTDIGPNLSEIGTKLGKDALYEAILDPSAGISFGYEAWQVELKNGDEAFGLIVSETADEIAVKTQTGIVTKYKKTDIAKREKQKLSIMPTGLQQTLTTRDLVDLLEYLASLRKAAN